MSEPTEGSTLRVVVAHPAALLRDLIGHALAAERLTVLTVVDTVQHLVERTRAGRPDVVLTAGRLRDGPIDAALPDLLGTGARVLVVTSGPIAEDMLHLLAAGASGYLDIDASSPRQLTDAVTMVAQGHAALHPALAAAILRQWRNDRAPAGPPAAAPARRHSLSSREVQILQAIADGQGARSIARRYGMAPKTVENHKARMFAKLGVRSQAEAVSVALSEGLLATGGSSPALEQQTGAGGSVDPPAPA